MAGPVRQGPLDRTLSRRQVLQGGLAGASAVLATGVAAPRAASATDRARDVGITAPAGPSTPAPPDTLTTAGMTSPIGVGTDDVTFGWQVVDPRRGARQGPTGSWCGRPRRAAPAPASARPGRGTAAGWSRPTSRPSPTGAGRWPPTPCYRWTVQTWDATGAAGPVVDAGHVRDRPARRRLAGVVDHPGAGSTPEPDQYTYARTEFALAGVADRAGPCLRVGRPAVRAVGQRHPGRQGPGVLLPRLAVLRDPRRHGAAAARCRATPWAC